MNQPILKAEASWGQPSGIASARESILSALNDAADVGPGEYLRQLREVAKLEINEVATQLGLNKAQVIAMESNDFENLPAPIYLKGFYRRYCNLLAISVEPVLKAYAQATTEVSPELNRVALKSQMNLRHASMRYASYTVIALFVLMFVYWLKDVDFGALTGMVSGGTEHAASSSSSTELSLPMVEELPVPGNNLVEEPKE